VLQARRCAVDSSAHSALMETQRSVFVFSAFALAGGLRVITARNPVNAVLSGAGIFFRQPALDALKTPNSCQSTDPWCRAARSGGCFCSWS